MLVCDEGAIGCVKAWCNRCVMVGFVECVLGMCNGCVLQVSQGCDRGATVV